MHRLQACFLYNFQQCIFFLFANIWVNTVSIIFYGNERTAQKNNQILWLLYSYVDEETLNDQRSVHSLNPAQIPIKTHKKFCFLEFNWSFITQAVTSAFTFSNLQRGGTQERLQHLMEGNPYRTGGKVASPRQNGEREFVLKSHVKTPGKG